MMKVFFRRWKTINVLYYIVKRLVVSSFYGSCNFQSSQTQQNNYNQITKNENSFLKENSLIYKNNKKKTKIYLRKIIKMRIQLLIIIFIIYIIIIF